MEDPNDPPPRSVRMGFHFGGLDYYPVYYGVIEYPSKAGAMEPHVTASLTLANH